MQISKKPTYKISCAYNQFLIRVSEKNKNCAREDAYTEKQTFMPKTFIPFITTCLI